MGHPLVRLVDDAGAFDHGAENILPHAFHLVAWSGECPCQFVTSPTTRSGSWER
jgi:hypothetical protein